MTYTMDGWVVEPDYDAWLEEQYEEQCNAYMEEQQQRDYEAWVLKYGDPYDPEESDEDEYAYGPLGD